jgi:polysaccharide export outer membrane protein
MKLSATIVLGLTLAIPLAGQQAVTSGDDSFGPAKSGTQAGGTTQVSSFADRFPRYQLRSGDTFELSFQFSPELNQTVSVQPDGFITLGGVGDMNVAGLTIPELKKRLEDAYGAFLNKPAIFVVLRDFDKPYFIATGMVARPGKYELRGDVTVIEGIAMAGGLNDKSKHSQVVLFRKASNNWFEAKVLNVKEMLASKDLSEDLHLKPGDIVYVPQNRISKIRPFIPSTGMGIYATPPL